MNDWFFFPEAVGTGSPWYSSMWGRQNVPGADRTVKADPAGPSQRGDKGQLMVEDVFKYKTVGVLPHPKESCTYTTHASIMARENQIVSWVGGPLYIAILHTTMFIQ